MAEERDETEAYPDETTKRIIHLCDRIDAIKCGDGESLPQLVREAVTNTLIGVYQHYEDIRSDNEKFGEGEVPFSEWDHEVMTAVREELSDRGLKPVPPELADFVDMMLHEQHPTKTH